MVEFDREHLLIEKKQVGHELVPYKAMIVDDSAFMVKNLDRILKSFEVEVLCTASNGLEAVENFKKHKDELDFCTLDITMPEMNGIEALEKMLEIDPKFKIMMVSAMGQKETVKKCIQLGAKHFIVKPFQRDKVHGVLESVLGLAH